MARRLPKQLALPSPRTWGGRRCRRGSQAGTAAAQCFARVSQGARSSASGSRHSPGGTRAAFSAIRAGLRGADPGSVLRVPLRIPRPALLRSERSHPFDCGGRRRRGHAQRPPGSGGSRCPCGQSRLAPAGQRCGAIATTRERSRRRGKFATVSSMSSSIFESISAPHRESIPEAPGHGSMDGRASQRRIRSPAPFAPLRTRPAAARMAPRRRRDRHLRDAGRKIVQNSCARRLRHRSELPGRRRHPLAGGRRSSSPWVRGAGCSDRPRARASTARSSRGERAPSGGRADRPSSERREAGAMPEAGDRTAWRTSMSLTIRRARQRDLRGLVGVFEAKRERRRCRRRRAGSRASSDRRATAGARVFLR